MTNVQASDFVARDARFLSPLELGTTPTTAFALMSATMAFGSLSVGAFCADRSVANSASRRLRIARSTASMSICSPASSAILGVNFAAFIPCGKRAASVQNPSLPNFQIGNVAALRSSRRVRFGFFNNSRSSRSALMRGRAGAPRETRAF